MSRNQEKRSFFKGATLFSLSSLIVVCSTLVPASAFASFSVEGYLGKAFPLSADLTLRQGNDETSLTFYGVQFTDRSFDQPYYFGVRVGYHSPATGSIRLEAELIHYKVYADPNQILEVRGTYRNERLIDTVSLGEYIQRLTISHGVNLIFANLSGGKKLASLRGWSRPVAVTGRLGIGVMLLHPETVVSGERRSDYQLGGYAYQAAAGFQFPIWRRIAGQLEYKLTIGGATIDVSGGTIDLNLTCQHLVFGLSFLF